MSIVLTETVDGGILRFVCLIFRILLSKLSFSFPDTIFGYILCHFDTAHIYILLNCWWLWHCQWAYSVLINSPIGIRLKLTFNMPKSLWHQSICVSLCSHSIWEVFLATGNFYELECMLCHSSIVIIMQCMHCTVRSSNLKLCVCVFFQTSFFLFLSFIIPWLYQMHSFSVFLWVAIYLFTSFHFTSWHVHLVKYSSVCCVQSA